MVVEQLSSGFLARQVLDICLSGAWVISQSDSRAVVVTFGAGAVKQSFPHQRFNATVVQSLQCRAGSPPSFAPISRVPLLLPTGLAPFKRERLGPVGQSCASDSQSSRLSTCLASRVQSQSVPTQFSPSWLSVPAVQVVLQGSPFLNPLVCCE